MFGLGPVRHWDWMDWFGATIMSLFSLVLALVVFGIIYWIFYEVRFHNQPVIIQKGYLLNIDYKPSTLSTRCVPVFHSRGGMSTAMYTTGHSEKNLTIWDCGKYGRITCDDKTVFRLAKDESMLKLKAWKDDVRIVGIE